jgi:hypothetical protein
MNHSEFAIGQPFWCGGNKYWCTDVGTRAIIAIRVDPVEVVRADGTDAPPVHRPLSESEARAEGWFNGPPYALAEDVFDEYDFESCSLDPEDDE